MRVLVGKTFGIGNAVLSVPMIKAISSAGHDVDVLIGTGPDDKGARDVLENLVGSAVGGLYFDFVPPSVKDYDVAVMAIPYDGRWKNRIHFSADRVIDCRPRPDPSTFGFVSWQKHEIEYQMENAVQLGFTGETPQLSFRERQEVVLDRIYLGVGYKKDLAGYWRQKHWGNEKYVAFIDECCRIDGKIYFVTTGDSLDLEDSIIPIVKSRSTGRIVYQPTFGLQQSFDVVGSCGAYVGNDTGMMHVAASFGMPVLAFFGTYGDHGNAVIKNRPVGSIASRVFTDRDCDPRELAREFIKTYREI